MPNFTDKDHLIVAQNSATAASNIVAAAVASGSLAAAEINPVFDVVRQHIYQGTLALAGEGAAAPAQPVATPVATAAAEAAPAPTPVPTATAPPASAAGDVTIDFGKFTGKTIAQVFASDPDYLDWAVQNMDNKPEFIAQVNEFRATRAAV